MGRYSLSVAFGAALLLAGLAAPARANMVVLECVFGTSADQPHMHHLLEIDYAANTVRSHYVDDDGAPYTLNGHGMGDSTNPAQITTTPSPGRSRWCGAMPMRNWAVIPVNSRRPSLMMTGVG